MREDMKMHHCANCGRDFEGNFCPECGAKAPAPPVTECPQCGTHREEGTKFCPNCGYSYEQAKEKHAKRAKKAGTPLLNPDSPLCKQVLPLVFYYAPLGLFALFACLLWAFYSASGAKVYERSLGSVYALVGDDKWIDVRGGMIFWIILGVLSLAYIGFAWYRTLSPIWRGHAIKLLDRSVLVSRLFSCGTVVFYLIYFVSSIAIKGSIRREGARSGGATTVVLVFSVLFLLFTVACFVGEFILRRMGYLGEVPVKEAPVVKPPKPPKAPKPPRTAPPANDAGRAADTSQVAREDKTTLEDMPAHDETKEPSAPIDTTVPIDEETKAVPAYLSAETTDGKMTETPETNRAALPDTASSAPSAVTTSVTCASTKVSEGAVTSVAAPSNRARDIVRSMREMTLLPRIFYYFPLCLFALFSCLIWAFFSASVADVFGESFGNVYALIGDTEWLNVQANMIVWLILGALSLAYTGFVWYRTLSPVWRGHAVQVAGRSVLTSRLFSYGTAVFYLAFFVSSIVVKGVIKGEELNAGGATTLVLVFSLLFLLFTAASLVGEYFLRRAGFLGEVPVKEAPVVKKPKPVKAPVASLPKPQPPKESANDSASPLLQDRKAMKLGHTIYSMRHGYALGLAVTLLVWYAASIVLSNLSGGNSSISPFHIIYRTLIVFGVFLLFWLFSFLNGIWAITKSKNPSRTEQDNLRKLRRNTLASLWFMVLPMIVAAFMWLFYMEAWINLILCLCGASASVGILSLLTGAFNKSFYDSLLELEIPIQSLVLFTLVAGTVFAVLWISGIIRASKLKKIIMISDDDHLTQVQVVYRQHRRRHKASWLRSACAVLLLAAAAITPVWIYSMNIFRSGKVDNISIGDSQSFVISELGEPDEKESSWVWLKQTSDNLQKQIEKKERELESCEDFEEMERIIEELDKLYAKQEDKACPYIKITFDSKKRVSSVVFDAAGESSSSSKSPRLSEIVYPTLISSLVDPESVEYTAQMYFTDGSYRLEKIYPESVTKSSSTEYCVKWKSAWGSHTDYVKITNRTASDFDAESKRINEENAALLTAWFGNRHDIMAYLPDTDWRQYQ